MKSRKWAPWVLIFGAIVLASIPCITAQKTPTTQVYQIEGKADEWQAIIDHYNKMIVMIDTSDIPAKDRIPLRNLTIYIKDSFFIKQLKPQIKN